MFKRLRHAVSVFRRQRTKKCPACAEEIPARAKECKRCGQQQPWPPLARPLPPPPSANVMDCGWLTPSVVGSVGIFGLPIDASRAPEDESDDDSGPDEGE